MARTESIWNCAVFSTWLLVTSVFIAFKPQSVMFHCGCADNRQLVKRLSDSSRIWLSTRGCLSLIMYDSFSVESVETLLWIPGDVCFDSPTVGSNKVFKMPLFTSGAHHGTVNQDVHWHKRSKFHGYCMTKTWITSCQSHIGLLSKIINFCISKNTNQNGFLWEIDDSAPELK